LVCPKNPITAEIEETVTIKYNAPPASMITVRVFDLVGREVRTLYHGLSLGGQEIEWDGTDSKGKALPIGTYICHIQAEDATGTDSSTAAAPIVIGTRLE
jgi:flagellar hook assembly protein FlgD